MTGCSTSPTPGVEQPVVTAAAIVTATATSTPSPTADGTATEAAWYVERTREASAAGTALAAVATPVTAGTWRSADGRREAWLESWYCPPEQDLGATATAAGGEWPKAYGIDRLMVRLDGGTATMVDSQLGWCGDAQLGESGLDGRFWSPDGRVFYFTHAATPDGLSCGCCPELMAWNADTGATSANYIPSPDNQRVARLMRGEDEAATLEVSDANLVSMTSYSPPADTRPGGNPIWSPDGEWLAMPDWPAGCGQSPSGALALRLRDGHWLRQPAPDANKQVVDLGWTVDFRIVKLYVLFPGSEWSWDVATDTVKPLATP